MEIQCGHACVLVQMTCACACVHVAVCVCVHGMACGITIVHSDECAFIVCTYMHVYMFRAMSLVFVRSVQWPVQSGHATSDISSFRLQTISSSPIPDQGEGLCMLHAADTVQ